MSLVDSIAGGLGADSRRHSRESIAASKEAAGSNPASAHSSPGARGVVLTWRRPRHGGSPASAALAVWRPSAEGEGEGEGGKGDGRQSEAAGHRDEEGRESDWREQTMSAESGADSDLEEGGNEGGGGDDARVGAGVASCTPAGQHPVPGAVINGVGASPGLPETPGLVRKGPGVFAPLTRRGAHAVGWVMSALSPGQHEAKP